MEPKWTPQECFFLPQKSIKILLFPCKKQGQAGVPDFPFFTQDMVFICLAKKCGFSQPMVLPQPN